jgi:hypothetical protein
MIKRISICILILTKSTGPDWSSLERRSFFDEAESTPASGCAAVDVPMPREIIEVPIAAGEQETSGDSILSAAFWAILVHEFGFIWSPGVVFDFKQTRIDIS